MTKRELFARALPGAAGAVTIAVALTIWGLQGARYVNIGLAVVILILQGRQLRDVWRNIATDVRLRWSALLLFAFVGGYGSAEALWQHAPPAPRVGFTTIALIWAAIASLVPARYQQYEKRPRR